MNNRILHFFMGLAAGAVLVFTMQTISGHRKMQRARYEDWRKLNLVLRTVDENYVDSVDRQKVTDAAVSAALGALDPHSVYMPPRQLEATEEELSGNFSGIGIQFNVPNDTAVVIEVIPGGPAEKIGMQPGDRLLRVDTVGIAGVHFPQDSMVRRMKGPAGTKVTVTVQRGRETIPFEITRGKVPTYSVDAAFMVGDTTAFLRLSKFSRTTAYEFAEAALNLKAQGMKHLIVDLRDNGGGFFEQACQISNMFLDRGQLIVYMEGLHRRREDFYADGKGILRDVGLTLLVSDGTASSGEIFAGAMQDHKRATLVGRRTFGKGLVQEPVYFTDGSGIRLTVARYYTPSGRCIQKPYSEDYIYDIYRRYDNGEMVSADSMNVANGGIIPDIFVPMDTTKVGSFYINCNKKATPMRFASAFFDAHREALKAIGDYDSLVTYLDNADLERRFLDFASAKDGLRPTAAEWKIERGYMITQVQALVGRYSKLGDNAFYHIYLQTDEVYKAAMASSTDSR
ncbi:MAG: S41 family peptidase [Bacteroidales bacterium]|nr:S41 family peptidase [Bacteroidales bacterium]